MQKVIPRFGINPITAEMILPEVCERLGDAKNSTEAGNCCFGNDS